MTANISPNSETVLERGDAEKEFFTTPSGKTCIQTGWDALTVLIEECQMDTGIADLAHQHDHYRLGTPKRID